MKIRDLLATGSVRVSTSAEDQGILKDDVVIYDSCSSSASSVVNDGVMSFIHKIN
ncbi:hypothetical protein C900_04648 [Fulvivirga imtechensis AK7]|uniref:Uncharacterized protein n=1 Tax=Fulvivirga imtechensis AK7 TaxID=1237149 RepID=L8JLK3_9BACT|nr:hypothetical protein C900_04648 [Fulvivirga imtechensis AK7]